MKFLIDQLSHGGTFGIVGVAIPFVLLLAGIWAISFGPKRLGIRFFLGYISLSIAVGNIIWTALYCSWSGEQFSREGNSADLSAALATLELVKNMAQYALVITLLFASIGTFAWMIRNQMARRSEPRSVGF